MLEIANKYTLPIDISFSGVNRPTQMLCLLLHCILRALTPYSLLLFTASEDSYSVLIGVH